MRILLSSILIGSALLLAGCVDERDYYYGAPRYDDRFRHYHDYGDRRYDPRMREGWRDRSREGARYMGTGNVPRDRYGRPIWLQRG